MKIQINYFLYLEIINQVHEQFQSKKAEISCQDVYLNLIDRGIIYTNGRACKEALDCGLLEVHTEEPGFSFSEFLKVYPVFKRYPSNYFRKIDHFWEIEEELWNKVQLDRQFHRFSQEELEQLNRYFVNRKLSKENYKCE
ncbi:hypothetical protein [Facklamia miroungae]|uniref:Uncharacterized protein n=1 Tax=Facklamia miroungae TaxID=120956 RepID=A0A1G7NY85_9LACT|nr:hypothetical protein [Facklamia miroungae]NKZ28491.1 hypothetical protein [Facklamia miroungae]SDF78319.1 hypothetical protein SAMN05421791_10130 [Facklamia miroungae]